MANRIQVRKGLKSQWESVNPILAEGEPAYEIDTKKTKLGDGITAWLDLPYQIQIPELSGYVRKWQPFTDYKVGDQVVAPTSDIIIATADHTSPDVFAYTEQWSGGASRMALGSLAIARSYSNSPIITARTVVSNIASCSFRSGRVYRIGVAGNWTCSDVSSTYKFEICSASVADPANVTSGLTTIRQVNRRVDLANESRPFDQFNNHFVVNTSGSLQIKFLLSRINGAGSGSISANLNEPLDLFIDDLGGGPLGNGV